MYPAVDKRPRAQAGVFFVGGSRMTKDEKDKETLPQTQGEKEKPQKPGKDSKAQNKADRP